MIITEAIPGEIVRSASLFFRKQAACEAGISISFDDAFVDEWYFIKDLFGKYGAKVTFFVSNFDLLPDGAIEKLRRLQNEGHEIAFHGLRHLSAVKFVGENSIEEYLEKEIFPGICAMSGCGFPPATFSYPYGMRTSGIDSALLKYFKRVRGIFRADPKKRLADSKQIYSRCSKGVVFAAGIDNIYKNSLEDIRLAIKKAADTKKTLFLYAHKTSDEGGDYCTPVSRMESVMSSATEAGLKFRRIKDI